MQILLVELCGSVSEFVVWLGFAWRMVCGSSVMKADWSAAIRKIWGCCLYVAVVFSWALLSLGTS